MRINPVSSSISFECDKCKKQKGFNKYNLIPITGYASLGFGVASGILGHQKKIKHHKILAGLALFAGMAHVVLLKTLHKVGHKHK